MSSSAARLGRRSSAREQVAWETAHHDAEFRGWLPSVAEHVLSTSGRPLDQQMQRDFGERFGYDFSTVRIHDDANACRAAAALRARAFTRGEHIVFGEHGYAPATGAGRRLVAHELTHVVQQREQGGPMVVRRQVETPDLEAVVSGFPDVLVTTEEPVQRVIEALQRPSPVAGPSDVRAAYGVLEELSVPELIVVLFVLASRGQLETLIFEAGGAPEAYASQTVATYIRVVQFGRATEGHEDLVEQTARGVQSLPIAEQAWIVQYLSGSGTKAGRSLALRLLENRLLRLRVQRILHVRAVIREYRILLESDALTATEVAEVQRALRPAELKLRDLSRRGGLAASIASGAALATAGLLTDDLSAIGVFDDVLIPFVVVVGIVAGMFAVEELTTRHREAQVAVAQAIETTERTVLKAKRRQPQAEPSPLGAEPIPPVASDPAPRTEERQRRRRRCDPEWKARDETERTSDFVRFHNAFAREMVSRMRIFAPPDADYSVSKGAGRSTDYDSYDPETRTYYEFKTLHEYLDVDELDFRWEVLSNRVLPQAVDQHTTRILCDPGASLVWVWDNERAARGSLAELKQAGVDYVLAQPWTPPMPRPRRRR